MIKCYDEKVYSFFAMVYGVAIIVIPFLLIVLLGAVCTVVDFLINLGKRKEKSEDEDGQQGL